jgi:hypothetical protein
MKTAFKISILLNIGSLGGLIFLLSERQPAVAPTMPTVQAAPPAAVAASLAPVAEAALREEPEPFHWSQLDARDYHVYVKNLRAIGCPEPTVRAIVTADVDSVYQIFEHQLEQKLSAAENGSWSNQLSASGSEAAVKAALQKIPDEEAMKIADLLGLKPAATQVATAAAPAQVVPMTTPLVLENIDPVALGLTAEQMQVVESLRQNFAQQVGDANDPDYAARWRKAQAYEDSMLQGLLGQQVYTKFQIAQMAAQNQASVGH